MNKHNPWATIYTYDLHSSSEYLTATPSQRGIWFGVLMRAIYENKGPRVVGALSYGNRGCWSWVGCSLADLKKPNPLLRIEGTDVIVLFGYPDHERFRAIKQRDSNTERKRRYRQKLAETEG